EELRKKTFEDITPERWHALEADIHENQVFKKGYSQPYEKEYRKKDGTIFPIEIRGHLMKGEQGRPLGMWSFVRDVTDRKRAESALKESEEKYRLLVENANDAIFIAQDEVVKFPNPKTIEMVGYPVDELARTPFLQLIHPDDRDTVIDRHLRRLKGEKVPTPYTFRILNKSGGELWVELNAVLITWEGKPGTLNFLRDITEQKILEAQLQQAQKMEAIGTLAGGIAHDFNNLLMGIQGRTSLMFMDKDASHSQLEHLEGIQDHVQSAADLTRQLLGFARGGKYEVTPTDMNALLEKTSRMFGRTKKEINIHGKYGKDIWPVETDQAQIEQVLLNLYVNAWHAMPGGGELHLQTENVTLDAPFVKNYPAEPGRFVKISITDTGAGMEKTTRDRIFDPFFTTKEMGRGTGLGLASAYGIINNHGGIIQVDSVRGEGTVFSIFLPASEKAVTLEQPPSERILEGGERILLVDDEALVLDVGGQMLEKLGYGVVLARSGEEALGVFEEKKGAINMVILDMIMPDMGGGEIYDRLKALNPGVKVLLSSGYSIDGQASEILDRGCDGFIQKPFNIKDISHKIREILDREKA
ncbi:MAG: PAS domain S-box protein, partial [Deltaproteobacteria bacterium]|nr:PAS domain S-box protein [Deltaproteobacteria bacterium]